jgi:hypothetical protein
LVHDNPWTAAGDGIAAISPVLDDLLIAFDDGGAWGD